MIICIITTIFALGNIYFGFKEYKEAERYLKKALEFKKSYAVVFNLAVTFYKQYRYEDALIWFEKALNFCDESDYIETYATYAFTLLQIDKKKCREALNYLLEDNGTTLMEYDRFVLAYLCGDMVTAESLVKPMMGKFSLGVEEMSMVFDCLFQFNKKEEALKHLNDKIEILEDCDYNSLSEINQFKKAFSQEEYRKNLISSFRYDMSIVKECCYYGCKQHNPL